MKVAKIAKLSFDYNKIKKKRPKLKRNNNNDFKYNISLFTNSILMIIILFLVFGKYLILKKNKEGNKKIFIQNNKNNTEIEKKIKLLKQMTNNDENEYRGMKNCLENDPDQLECIYPYLNTKDVVGKKRILLGHKRDGCYVLLDDFEGIRVAYSFGISNNVHFDDALAKRGIDVYMYDHTISKLPFEHEKFHWKKIGLCGKNTNNPNLKTLEDLIKENGHTSEKNMILKMDIEYYEWESLIDLTEETLNQFKYIAVEYHFFGNSRADIFFKVIKKLFKTHQPFYIRCNGDRGNKFNFGNNRICFIMEVCYIIRKGNTFVKDENVLPMYEFDYSRINPGRLEMNLNLLRLFD